MVHEPVHDLSLEHLLVLVLCIVLMLCIVLVLVLRVTPSMTPAICDLRYHLSKL